MQSLDSYTTLVLNADYRPLNTYPLSRVPWWESVRDTLKGKVTVLEEYDRHVRSARMSMPIPSVVALNNYVNLNRPAPLNRMNLFLRDKLCCVFCGKKFKTHELTFDHLLPRARGGRGTWTNLVAACRPCNQRKGDRMPADVGMLLRSKPYHPTLAQLNQIGTEFGELIDIPVTWRDWIYWTVSLEP